MATITTRSGKGSPLTNNEVDANFTNLNSDKIESGDTVASLTITNADINGGDIASSVTVNKSPQLTLTGDVTGTVTFTNLANGSMTTTASADLLRVDGDGSDLQNVRAETIEVTVKNVSGGSLAKGTPVHQTGTSGAATFEVVAADASNASVMPAHFVLLETLANGAEGRGLLMGRISGVNTAGFAEGDTIYVAAGGGYTNVAPTGEGNLIQNLGTVTNVDATNGGGEVMGAGRSAATPNLNNGNIFIGNASNQAVTASLSTSVSNAGFATTSYVDTAVANLVDSAPAALDTLNELAAALGDDANFSTTVTNSIATKQDAATAVTTTTTFGGDVSGTYDAIIIADDSHNHIIGNVDGLQAALDAKQAASTALTTSTTFGGDVSGTFNAIVVADDSHNHVISNVDGLQTALNAKQDASTAVTTTTTFGGDVSGTYNAIVVADNSHSHVSSNISDFTESVQDVVGGMVSTNTENGISVTYDDTNGKLNFDVSDPTITLTGAVTGSGTITNLGNVSIATTNTADPTLTLAGDASGSATFTNLGNATLTVTVADDSHNHVISNVDGLQTALDAKQNSSTALTTSTTFGGDVSGTYNAIVVADDSHNHIIGNVDGLQTALDGKLGSTANAVSASKWATARTVSLTGAVTGSASVDGSANVSIATTHTADPTITLTGAVTGSGTMTNLGNVSIATTATADPTLTLAGDASGSATFTNLGNATLTVTVADDSHNHVISNVDGLQTALDGKINDTGDVITGALEQSYSGTVWSHSEGTVRPVSRLTYSEAGNIGTTGASITDVYGEADLSAIDNGATFTYAAAWDAVESHGGRLPTLAELMDGVGQGSGQSYDAEYLWTCTPAGPHHVWVALGDYSTASDRKIVDITNASEVYCTRAFFDVSRDGKTVNYEHNGILRIEGNNRAFHDGYHPNADKWTTARTLSLTGAVTGSASIDGSGNVSLATTNTADPTLTLNGDVSGSATFTNLGNATLTVTVADDSHNHVISNVDGLQTALDGKFDKSGGTITGNVTLSGADSENALTLSGSSPTMAFTDTTSGADDFFIYVNSNNFYILTDRGGAGGYNTWETPHPLQLEADTNIGYVFGNRIFDEGYHPNADKWTTSRTLTLNGDVSGSVSWDGSANATLTATVANDSHTHDGRYFTESESDARYVQITGGTYNPSGGSITTASHEGSINYVYNSTGGTPTRGDCSVHVYQQWTNNLSLALTSSTWQEGDIVRVSNAQGSANITVSATRIFLPDGTYDTSVTFDGTVGGFVLAKHNTTQGYWMVMP